MSDDKDESYADRFQSLRPQEDLIDAVRGRAYYINKNRNDHFQLDDAIIELGKRNHKLGNDIFNAIDAIFMLYVHGYDEKLDQENRFGPTGRLHGRWPDPNDYNRVLKKLALKTLLTMDHEKVSKIMNEKAENPQEEIRKGAKNILRDLEKSK